MKRSKPEGSQEKDTVSPVNKKPPRKDPIGNHYVQRVGADVEELNVFVKGFDVSIGQANIKEEFERCGATGLLDVRIPRHFDNHPKPFAYVTFDSNASALAAVEKCQGIIRNERPWFVAMSKPTKCVYEPNTLFVSGLDGLSIPEGTTAIEDLIKSVDVLVSCTVKEIRPIGSHKNKDICKGHGYVEFEENVEPLIVSEIHKEIHGRSLVLKKSVPIKDHRWQVPPKPKGFIQEKVHPVHEPPTDVLFVKNLSFKVTAEDIEDFFEEHAGPVTDVCCVKDEKTNKFKGFCYIQMDTEQGVSSGLALNGCEWKDRNISVEKSNRKITTKIIRPRMDIKEQKKRIIKSYSTKNEEEEEENEEDDQDGLAAVLNRIENRETQKTETQKHISKEDINNKLKILRHTERGKVRLDDDVDTSISDDEFKPKTNDDFRKMFLS